MKFTSTVFAAASGSVGGLTYSRNRGGQYTRRRAIPSNPGTEQQGIARENLATAVAWWTNELDAEQRQGWATYAQATPFVDALGQQIILSGQQMFVRTATIRLIAGLTNIFNPPTTSGLGNTPQITNDPIADASTQIVMMQSNADSSTVEDWLIAYMSRPVTASRTAAHETRRFFDAIAWVGSPTFYSTSGPAPFAVTTGQKVRVSCLIAWADGRISAQAFRDILVTA